MLDLVQSDGTVDLNALVEAFRNFYLGRATSGKPAEVANSLLSRPDTASLSEVKSLLVTYPLDRFIIMGYVERHPDARTIQIRPEIWEGLRYRDVVELRQSLQEPIDRYFTAKGPGLRGPTESREGG